MHFQLKKKAGSGGSRFFYTIWRTKNVYTFYSQPLVRMRVAIPKKRLMREIVAFARVLTRLCDLFLR
jgi:hypothetical protein